MINGIDYLYHALRRAVGHNSNSKRDLLFLNKKLSFNDKRHYFCYFRGEPNDQLASKVVLDVFQMYLPQKCCLIILVNGVVLDMISVLLYIYLGSLVRKNIY